MEETRESNLLTVAQVARRLNVSKPTVYRRISEGQIPALRIGEEIGPLRVPADELDEWIDLRRVSDDGSRQGQLRADASPAERREIPESRGQSSSRQPAGGR